MIELSGYTGKSANNIRGRLIASNELRTLKSNNEKKNKLQYSIQTLIMGKGFSIIPEGTISKQIFEVDVDSSLDFENFTFTTLMSKHKNPEHICKNKKYTIFSKINEEHLHVDILELINMPHLEPEQIQSLAY